MCLLSMSREAQHPISRQCHFPLSLLVALATKHCPVQLMVVLDWFGKQFRHVLVAFFINCITSSWLWLTASSRRSSHHHEPAPIDCVSFGAHMHYLNNAVYKPLKVVSPGVDLIASAACPFKLCQARSSTLLNLHDRQ